MEDGLSGVHGQNVPVNVDLERSLELDRAPPLSLQAPVHPVLDEIWKKVDVKSGHARVSVVDHNCDSPDLH